LTLQKGPVALIIMDGFGLNPRADGNAVAAARKPNIDALFAQYPWTQLNACGEAVGLMTGQMGDSNVGHLNLGAGRVVYQYMLRILKEAESGKLAQNQVLQEAIDQAVKGTGRLHFIGLVSHGGVHSHSKHLFTLLQMAKERGVPHCFVHAFTDGRDVPPTSGIDYITELETVAKQMGNVSIASVSGRYYAMDRDNRWDRTKKAYEAMVEGVGLTASSGPAAMQAAYDRAETDEFVVPTVITDAVGKPVATIEDGDVVFFFNFRADRARQITRAFTEPDFAEFATERKRPSVYFASLTKYDETFTFPYAVEAVDLTNTFGEYISKQGWRQLRIAETEKYAHVTYFFNGGQEVPFPGEDQVLIPSPKVATYDLKPEMSAYEVTERVLAEIARDYYEVIILNYANCDMVGHTGIMEAAIKAVETVDTCVGRVVDALLAKGGQAIVTADHGNSDQMVDYATGGPHTFHSLNPVPCILVSEQWKKAKLRPGILADVAPTLLELLELPVPPQMEGKSLIVAE
jgi:2,3-bisphosphoglycerate-independent phosphoglycerate mutase